MTPHLGGHCSLLLLPATPLSRAHALLPELRRYTDIKCDAHCANVRGHSQKQLMQTLLVCL